MGDRSDNWQGKLLKWWLRRQHRTAGQVDDPIGAWCPYSLQMLQDRLSGISTKKYLVGYLNLRQITICSSQHTYTCSCKTQALDGQAHPDVGDAQQLEGETFQVHDRYKRAHQAATFLI
ncbi:hypothetical protein EVAR_17175_1 [Eumeta japonica]|uniref:Uncharacterized protein n=1 Tax=Eumeta variegata TaxID=151549 RepID=A0A4C1U8Z0_EUMVA|nr:hypothetical protein EVAR_17175_1 [Eumeta japonica]